MADVEVALTNSLKQAPLLDSKPAALKTDVKMADVNVEVKPEITTDVVMDNAAKEELEEGELRSDEVNQRPS